MSSVRTAKPAVGRDELIARARDMVPFLLERASATEQNRSLLPDVHRRLVDGGLLRITLPSYLGGYGLDLATHLEVATELARGCGSTAWIQSLIGNQNAYSAWYPGAVLDRLKADGKPLFTALVMGPPATARRVDGGVRLAGRWPYVSGVDQASWMMLSARDPDNEARVLTCMMRKEQGAVLDDWHAMGMRGTGSKSVLLDDVFVPDSHVLCFREVEVTGPPGAAVCPDSPLIGAPNSIIFAMVVAAPAIGLAACAIDAFRERLRSRWNARMPSSQTEWPTSQARLGRARVRLAAAKLSLLRNAEALQAQRAAGEAISLEQKVIWRAETVEMVTTCTGIVNDLFGDAGTGAVMDGSVLQRAFRDIHTLRSHFMLMPDPSLENAGRIQLDLPPRAPYAGG